MEYYVIKIHKYMIIIMDMQKETTTIYFSMILTPKVLLKSTEKLFLLNNLRIFEAHTKHLYRKGLHICTINQASS